MRDAFRVLGGNEPDWGGLVTERGRVMGTPRPSRRLLTAIVPVVLFALLAIPAASANANHQAVGRGTTTEFICANRGFRTSPRSPSVRRRARGSCRGNIRSLGRPFRSSAA